MQAPYCLCPEKLYVLQYTKSTPSLQFANRKHTKPKQHWLSVCPSRAPRFAALCARSQSTLAMTMLSKPLSTWTAYSFSKLGRISSLEPSQMDISSGAVEASHRAIRLKYPPVNATAVDPIAQQYAYSHIKGSKFGLLDAAVARPIIDPAFRRALQLRDLTQTPAPSSIIHYSLPSEYRSPKARSTAVRSSQPTSRGSGDRKHDERIADDHVSTGMLLEWSEHVIDRTPSYKGFGDLEMLDIEQLVPPRNALSLSPRSLDGPFDVDEGSPKKRVPQAPTNSGVECDVLDLTAFASSLFAYQHD